MREGHALARTISIGVRRNNLSTYTRQKRTQLPTNITSEIAHCAWELLEANEPLSADSPLRALSVRTSNLVPDTESMQLMLFDPLPKRTERMQLEMAIDSLRSRYGNNCVIWGPKCLDDHCAAYDAKGTNIVHPVSFFHR